MMSVIGGITHRIQSMCVQMNVTPCLRYLSKIERGWIINLKRSLVRKRRRKHLKLLQINNLQQNQYKY